MPKDERIVFSARCTWWSTIHNAGKIVSPDAIETHRSGLPCCPFCGSPLYEVEDETTWWLRVNEYAEDTHDEEYPSFILWMRGKCYTNMEEAKDAYLSRT